jgi:GT2 family glycosyltransferase
MSIGIVPTYYNRNAHLINTLASFKQYNPQNFFVVIVDDGSPEDIKMP